MEVTKSARVKSDTDSSSLAGFIAHIFESNQNEYCLNCIGPAAVNQAAKAVATARGFLAPKGIDIAMIPTYFKTQTERRNQRDNAEDAAEEERTGIQWTVFRL